MKSLKILFEIFMPEARFPDEKFWNKDGSSIHPDPKGPPKGTLGKTHRELGYWDADDNLDEPPHGQASGQPGTRYASIDDVKKAHPQAYNKLREVLRDLSMDETDLARDPFYYEDGVLGIDVTDPSGADHPIFWNEQEQNWEYAI